MAEIIVLPKIGVNMTEATIEEWSVEIGGSIKEGETLAVAETDKAAQDIYAPVSGTVLAHLVEAGALVQCQEPIAVIGENGEDISSMLAGANAAVPNEPVGKTAPPVEAPSSSAADTAASRTRISPLARKLAAANQIEIGVLSAGVPGARITKKDVIRYLESGAETAVFRTSAPGERRIAMNRIQKTMGKRMTLSAATIPQAVLSLRVDASGLLSWKGAAKEKGIRISITDMVLMGLGRALRKHPMLNSRLEGDEIVISEAINIGVAVDSPEGLVVPVIGNADSAGISQIGATLRDLSEKARSGGLSIDEMTGGTFTLTNLGMFGIEQFIPIINPPECAILAVGAATEQVVPYQGGTAVRPIMWASLAFDHRIVDGATASKFFSDLKDKLEQPMSMFV
jgi:pyruvate dehydrogenase E2 component (dihydrolipoamide acetyltransferase)